MKKALIAGVASVALAAMPIVGVVATDDGDKVDTITVSFAEFCTFNATSHTYNATMAANGLNENVGTTSMTVTCNKNNGYYVGASFEDLSGNGSTKVEYDNATPTAGSGTWTAYRSAGSVNGTAVAAANLVNGGRVIENQHQAPAAGDTATIVYKVGLLNNQAAGTYTGHAVYTLTSPYAAA